jgi:hypothetical protein
MSVIGGTDDYGGPSNWTYRIIWIDVRNKTEIGGQKWYLRTQNVDGLFATTWGDNSGLTEHSPNSSPTIRDGFPHVRETQHLCHSPRRGNFTKVFPGSISILYLVSHGRAREISSSEEACCTINKFAALHPFNSRLADGAYGVGHLDRAARREV